MGRDRGGRPLHLPVIVAGFRLIDLISIRNRSVLPRPRFLALPPIQITLSRESNERGVFLQLQPSFYPSLSGLFFGPKGAILGTNTRGLTIVVYSYG